MQQCRNRHIFISAKLQHQRSHAHQVRNIRHRRSLAGLPRMLLRRKNKCQQKSRTKLYPVRTPCPPW